MKRSELLCCKVFDVVELFEDLLGGGVLLVKGTQEGGCGKLGALVDSHRQNILLGHFQLDPTTALRNDAAGVERTITDARCNAEVNTG